VTRYLRERFSQDKIVISGQSWGTIPAVLAAQRHPEMFRAYVGVGQMVDPLETDTIFYNDTLAWARSTNDTNLSAKLIASGPPPYGDVLDYEATLSHEPDVYPYDHSNNSEGVGAMSENLLVREYSLLQQAHVLAAFMDVFTVLYPQLQRMDFRTGVPELDVPGFLAQGRHEAPGRARPAEQWFAALDAPIKELSVFETSGHRPLFEQPAQFHRFMVDVLERT
jgi:pimeloyl-ACP methyl ester carboxylesterase